MQKQFTQQDIDNFVSGQKIAFVGVSANPKKFGTVMFHDLTRAGFDLYPVNPKLATVGDKRCYPNLSAIPDDVEHAFFITPKNLAADMVEQAAAKGIKQIWFQLGAADEAAIELARNKNITVIHDECLYMFTKADGIHGFHKWLRRTFGKMPQ